MNHPKTCVVDAVKVLVVEDDDDSRDLLSNFLIAYGLSVLATASASEGFCALTTFRPDVIVSDIHMPGEDGLSFIRRVRGLDAALGGATPAIALTGGSMREEIRDAGFHLHMVKPFKRAQLYNAICDLARSS